MEVLEEHERYRSETSPTSPSSPFSPASTSTFFRRSIRSSTSITRISIAIRRSLRLPSRRSNATFDSLKKKYPLIEEEAGERFTQFSDLRVNVYPAIPSRLDEIKENRRLGRTNKVKQIVRKANWPSKHEVRKHLWKELCRDKSYDASIAVFKGETSEQILHDARLTSPSFLKQNSCVLNSYNLTEDGVVQLTRLLAMVQQLRPDISSAPILYPLCALLMLYMSDADAYACIQYLTRRGQDKSPPVHLLMTEVQWEATPYVLLALVKKHKSNAYAALKKKLGTADDEIIVRVFEDWKAWLFQYMPFSHIARVVDCFLVEGHKFLLRAAIAIIYLWSKELKARETNRAYLATEGLPLDERVRLVKEDVQKTAISCQVSIETYIEMCVYIKNLKGSTIVSLQSAYEKKLRGSIRSPRQVDNVFCYTLPFQSAVVSKEIAQQIIGRLPSRLQLVTPTLLFRLSEDGASFTHLWSKIDEYDQSIIVIQSNRGEVFGAYCSASWAERNDRRERTKSKYFGTGESFVFKVENNSVQIFGWVGNRNNTEKKEQWPQMFMTAADRLLVIGSGGGDAIRISEELSSGITSRSETFDSPPLVPSGAFDINEMEVFSVVASQD